MPYFRDNNGRRGGGGYGRGGYGYEDRRGGYGDRGYDYDDRRGGGGYGRGGYDEPQRQFRFDIGQKVIHTATGQELSVVRHGREQLECRKADLSTVWLYEYELEPVGGDNNQ